MARLVDLNPSWVGYGGEGVTDKYGNTPTRRHGVGITFDCPCGCDELVYIPFCNPLDGGPSWDDDPRRAKWERTGETFETLTLVPSIQRMGECRWHGWVTNGETREA